MNKTSEDLLRSLLKHDHDYYILLAPSVSDAEYDQMAKRFAELEPNHPYNKKVGAVVPVDNKKVFHRLVAGSQEKIKTEKEALAWGEKNSDPQRGNVMQWKLDGFTLVLQYTDGCLNEAASRGDGEVGESVLWNAVSVDSIPKRLRYPYTGDVRGELILSRSKFKSIFAPLGFANPRNSVSVIRDQKGTGLAKHLDFIAFDFEALSNPPAVITETGRVDFMKSLGFNVVETQLFNLEDLWAKFNEFDAARSNYDYDTDGVVVRFNSLKAQAELGSSSDNRPKGQRAIKFANDEAETTFVGVEYTIGSTGAVVPTGKFNPVEIGGTVVKSVLLNNFQYIQDRGGLCTGDTVRISKAGGIIPWLAEVFPRYDHQTGQRVGTPIVAPTTCPWCESSLVTDGAVTKCVNEECDGRGMQQVKQWITKRDIKQIGDVLLQALYDDGKAVKASDLYRLDEATIASMTVGNGQFGFSRAKVVMSEIEKSRTCSLQDLMGSVCIKFLGRREAEIIMEKTGVSTLEGWFNLKESDLLSVGGYKENKAGGIVRGIQRAKEDILELASYLTILEPSKPKEEKGKTTEGAFSGETLLFTGKIERCDETGARYTRKKMQELAISQGALIEEDFKSNVTILVTAELDSTSSKMKKAQKAGVRIMSEEEFFQRAL